MEPYRDLPLVSVRTLLPWRNTCGQGLPQQQKGLIAHRALQLILPFEPALPDRRLILAQRLWPTMPPRARQRLAKRLAHLLRSEMIAADARELSGGPRMNVRLNLQSPLTTAHRAKLPYIYVQQSTAG